MRRLQSAAAVTLHRHILDQCSGVTITPLLITHHVVVQCLNVSTMIHVSPPSCVEAAASLANLVFVLQMSEDAEED